MTKKKEFVIIDSCGAVRWSCGTFETRAAAEDAARLLGIHNEFAAIPKSNVSCVSNAGRRLYFNALHCVYQTKQSGGDWAVLCACHERGL
jgi:hypothetical protein